MFFNPDKKDQILEQELANPNAYTDALICAEASRLSQDERVAFAESEEAQALLEKQMISRRTLVRLSKKDDLARRVKMAAFQVAKEKKDPLWTKLVLNRVKERQLIAKIVQKYHNAAVKLAKVGQREFIKSASKVKALPNKK